MIVLEILGQLFFWLVMLAAIAVIPMGIPGTFIIVANSLVYALLTDFAEVSVGILGILLAIAVLAEVAEFYLGAATAGKYGASRQGMIGAIVGGIVGAIWLTAFFPLVGTIAGAFVGAFAGATLFEYLNTRDWEKSVRVGIGAFLGSVGGKLTKIAAATGMVVLVGVRIF